MKTCPYGHPVLEEHLFCPLCGAAVAEPTEPPGQAAGESDFGFAPTSFGSEASQRAEAIPPPPIPHPGRSRGRKRTALVVVGLGVVVAVALVVGLVLRGGSTHQLRGTLLLFDSDTVENDCVGTGGYNDISAGAAVTVRNGSGDTLATGQLGNGEAIQGVGCTYKFVTEVPDSEFYRVEVTHRGELEYSKAEMEQQDWKVEATLGEP